VALITLHLVLKLTKYWRYTSTIWPRFELDCCANNVFSVIQIYLTMFRDLTFTPQDRSYQNLYQVFDYFIRSVSVYVMLHLTIYTLSHIFKSTYHIRNVKYLRVLSPDSVFIFHIVLVLKCEYSLSIINRRSEFYVI
jgi:hypothetical protein